MIVYANGAQILKTTIPGTNGSVAYVLYSATLSATTNSSGDVVIDLIPDTTFWKEKIFVDTITVALDATNPPTVTPSTFSVSETASNGTVVGTVSATDAPTS